MQPPTREAVTVDPDRVPGGLLTLTADFRIASANAPLGALVGRDPADLVGTPFDELLARPAKILFQTHVYPALTADGRVEEAFLTLASPDGGDPTPILLNAARSPDVNPAAYDALVVRIQARSRWELDLLSATRALEAERTAGEQLARDLAAAAADLRQRYANEQRDREFRDAFVGVISHELRTPITTIYGMSHVLRQRYRSLDEATIERHLRDIEDESDRLRRLTEDLLVLSRAEGQQLALARDPIVLGHLARRAVEAERARSAEHHFAVDVPPGLPLVAGEEVYVDQVIRNFLNNAAKYSPAGSTVRVALDAEDGGVALRVVDRGRGLAGADRTRLFELFYRAPDAMRQTAGAGIGLFVCRELIEAMGGRVWASDAGDRSADDGDGDALSGAEFGFWLPTAADDLAAGVDEDELASTPV